MHVIEKTQSLRDKIENTSVLMGLDKPCFTKMLDYTIEIFEDQGLGKDYYGYHNITHELEVTYVTLVAANWKSPIDSIHKMMEDKLTVSHLLHCKWAFFHNIIKSS